MCRRLKGVEINTTTKRGKTYQSENIKLRNRNLRKEKTMDLFNKECYL